MRWFPQGHFMKTIVFFLGICIFFSQNPVSGSAHAVAAATKVKHKPVKYFVPEKRITLTAYIKDKKGVELVRCYFRAKGEANFVFVPMAQTKAFTYSAVLPAPGGATQAIEYVFLAVNKEQQIVKTQTFAIPERAGADTPDWQQAGSEGSIAVKTELDQPPKQLAGFSDSIVIDQVESSMRFGMVAGGLYAVTSSAAAGMAAAAAGTITATAGISTAVIVGVGVAAAGGVGVAVSSSGGGGSGSSDAGTSDTGTSDTGTSDTGTSDTGTSDTGTSEAGSSATGPNLEYENSVLTNTGDEGIEIETIIVTYAGYGYLYQLFDSTSYTDDNGILYTWSVSGDDLVCTMTVNQTLSPGEYYNLYSLQTRVQEYAGALAPTPEVVVNTSSGTYTF